MNVNNKTFDVYFRRNKKERFWKLEKAVDIYDFRNLLNEMLIKTTEPELELRLIINKNTIFNESRL